MNLITPVQQYSSRVHQQVYTRLFHLSGRIDLTCAVYTTCCVTEVLPNNSSCCCCCCTTAVYEVNYLLFAYLKVFFEHAQEP